MDKGELSRQLGSEVARLREGEERRERKRMDEEREKEGRVATAAAGAGKINEVRGFFRGVRSEWIYG